MPDKITQDSLGEVQKISKTHARFKYHQHTHQEPYWQQVTNNTATGMKKSPQLIKNLNGKMKEKQAVRTTFNLTAQLPSPC